MLERMLALGARLGWVTLVDESTGEERWAVQAHAGQHAGSLITDSTSVAMSPSGRLVASVGSKDENWMLSDAESGAVWMAGARHDGTGACVCEVNELGRRVVLQEECPAVAHTAGLTALAFSPCGHWLATGDSHGVVILWDAQTGEAEGRMQRGSQQIWSLSFSADGVRLAVSGRARGGRGEESIHMWDVTTGALLCTWEAGDVMSLVQFSPVNNSFLLSISLRYGEIQLWDVESGEMMRGFEGRRCAAFSQDGRTFSTVSNHSEDVHIVDVETGAVRRALVGHQTSVGSACFAMDGTSRLVSVSGDGTCKVWAASTGALLRTMEVGDFPILSMSWGRDWVRDTQARVVFAMGHHPRLGERSGVLALDAGVVRMILDCV